MMIVMPTFTECKQGNQKAVPAIIFRVEAAATKDMSHRVDLKRTVIE